MEVNKMAVKDYQVQVGQKAIVVNADGRVWRMDKLPAVVKEKTVIGTDTFKNDLGEDILHIWID
jgi:hypothetical protein